MAARIRGRSRSRDGDRSVFVGDAAAAAAPMAQIPPAGGPMGPLAPLPGRAAPGTAGAGDPTPWDVLYTFRTFVLDRVTEDMSPESAKEAYEAYKRDFSKTYTRKIFEQLTEASLASLLERYQPALLGLERAADGAQLHEVREGLLRAFAAAAPSLREPMQAAATADGGSPRGADFAMPVRVMAPQSEPQQLLSAPIFTQADPDQVCLILKPVPATVTKWDLKAHAEKVGAAAGLVSVAMVEAAAGGEVGTVAASPPGAIGAETQGAPGGGAAAGASGAAAAGASAALVLTARSAQSSRVAFLQYDTAANCAAAESKLEGTHAAAGKFICHPQKRVPQPRRYTYCLLPSEACHPLRMLRDLRLSARIVLKYDAIAEAAEGAAPDLAPALRTADDASFFEACAAHPVLAGLPEACRAAQAAPPAAAGADGAFAPPPWAPAVEAQLTRQVLYLMFAHRVCYYAGRRFGSLREIWETVGLQMLFPAEPADAAEAAAAAAALKFEASDEYLMGADLLAAAEAVAEAGAGAGGGGENSSLASAAAGSAAAGSAAHRVISLIPPPAAGPEAFAEGAAYRILGSSPGGAGGAQYKAEQVKSEASAAAAGALEDDAAASGVEVLSAPASPVRAPLKKEEEVARGRESPWLLALEQRLLFLLAGDASWRRAAFTSESPEFEPAWLAHCEKTMFEQEAEKWRCELCRKMFRGANFVVKHLRNKHFATEEPKVLAGLVQAAMWAAFCADPDAPVVQLPPPTPHAFYGGGRRLRGAAAGGGHAPPGRQGPGRFQRPFYDYDAPPAGQSLFEKGNLREIVQYGDL